MQDRTYTPTRFSLLSCSRAQNETLQDYHGLLLQLQRSNGQHRILWSVTGTIHKPDEMNTACLDVSARRNITSSHRRIFAVNVLGSGTLVEKVTWTGRRKWCKSVPQFGPSYKCRGICPALREKFYFFDGDFCPKGELLDFSDSIKLHAQLFPQLTLFGNSLFKDQNQKKQIWITISIQIGTDWTSRMIRNVSVLQGFVPEKEYLLIN